MKLSLRWLCDHVELDWRSVDVKDLVARFNKTTAEIEGFDHIKTPIENWFIAVVHEISQRDVKVTIPENNQTVNVPLRTDTRQGGTYLIKKEDQDYRWVTMQDLGSGKEGFAPALSVQSGQEKGAWRDAFESHDYIIHLDNKSVNHRPDLWGHRGIARELGAMFDAFIKPIETLIVSRPIATHDDTATTGPFTVRNLSEGECSRFAALYLHDVKNKASDLFMTVRLARVDIKPIDAIVDATNYVMMDLGHPMHAFDAETLPSHYVVVRQAKNKESLNLLDGTVAALIGDDIVISDDKKPISLAGIMGSKETEVTGKTGQILLEAACFDAVTIRRTAMRLKKRTESSARFEKSLDPEQTTTAIMRLLKVLEDASVSYTAENSIALVGVTPIAQPVITIAHATIEARLGTSIAPDFVQNILAKLDFEVRVASNIYTITVPSFRATKDIAIAEDIIEEIGRFFGYENIQAQPPVRQMRPFSLHSFMQERAIKDLLAYGFHMKEIQTYALFDEEWLKELAWDPGTTLRVQLPVSDNLQRLATTLVPGLCRMVAQYSVEQDTVNLFELAHVWPHHDSEFQEQVSIAGIWSEKKKEVSFYDGKARLNVLFEALGLSVTWSSLEKPLYPWYLPYQSASIVHEGMTLGFAGKVHPAFYQKVGIGTAFIFELDARVLMHAHQAIHRYEPISKYPRVFRDVSMLIPRTVLAKDIAHAMQSVDARIKKVVLLDLFEKAEWQDKKSLTFRMCIEDMEKTLVTADIDRIVEHITKTLSTFGAQVR